jgi:hypothetical protein
MSKKFNVYITVYHCIRNIEARDKDHAKELSKEEIWDDHIKDAIIDVEEIKDEK